MSRLPSNPTIAIAGSRALPKGSAPRLLVRFLAGLPPATTVILRRGLFTQPNIFEAQVEGLCDLIGLDVEWCQPEFEAEDSFQQVPTEEGGVVQVPLHMKGELGRRATFRRDRDMVDRADLVLCFYVRNQIGDETSGTAALVEKALQAEKPVYSYAMDGEAVERVGEHDPADLWASLVPAG